MTAGSEKRNSGPSICLVAHFAYGAMAGGYFGHIGGVERQTSLMAKWFAAHGHRVSMLTWDEGQEDEVEIDGVRIIKMCRRNAGLPGLRFFWPRWTSLNAAMRRADADIYYQNCAEHVTGQVAMWCRRHGRKLIYSVASDPDCDVRLPEMRKLRDRVLYRYGLRHADRIIVQTQRQQDMLREGFKRNSVKVPMPCVALPEAESRSDHIPSGDTKRVLWIGRVCKVKRPDRLLELARRCPDMVFDFVGPSGETTYARDIVGRAESIPNLNVYGPASRNEVSRFYRQADLMCCTSDFEGFPNTFLEAWSHGLPIVSTFDPDGLIADKGLGIAVNDVSELAAGLQKLLDSPEQLQHASRTAREYYLANHTVDVAMAKFEQIFMDVFPGGGESLLEGESRNERGDTHGRAICTRDCGRSSLERLR